MKKIAFAEIAILIGILSTLNAAFAQAVLGGIQELNTYSYAVVGLVILLFVGYMFVRRFTQEFMGQSQFAGLWDKLILVLFIFVGISAVLTMFGIQVPQEAQGLMGVPVFLAIGLIGSTMMVEGGMAAFSRYLTRHKGAMVVEELREEAYEASKLGDPQRAKFLRELAKDMEEEEKDLKEAEKEAIKLGEPEEVRKIREEEKRVLEEGEIAATVAQIGDVEQESGKGKGVLEQAAKALITEEDALEKVTQTNEIGMEKQEIEKRKELAQKMATETNPKLKRKEKKKFKGEQKEVRAMDKARKAGKRKKETMRELTKEHERQVKEEGKLKVNEEKKEESREEREVKGKGMPRED